MIREREELEVQYKRSVEDIEAKHRRELLDLEAKHLLVQGKLKEELQRVKEMFQKEQTAHAVSEGKLEVQTANVHISMKAPKNQTNIYLANVTPELGELLADKIGMEEFWLGQRGIARKLRSLEDADGKKYYEVKDENRAKLQIVLGGKKVRDRY